MFYRTSKKRVTNRWRSKKNIPSSRIRTSDLRIPFFTLQSSALPTELSKEVMECETIIKQIQFCKRTEK